MERTGIEPSAESGGKAEPQLGARSDSRSERGQRVKPSSQPPPAAARTVEREERLMVIEHVSVPIKAEARSRWLEIVEALIGPTRAEEACRSY
jgi:hypothetical protein